MFRLAHLSLANRALIALITVFASVFGVITMSSLKQELIPSIEFPQITVLTAMPGASPEVVDKQVSGPLEKALNGVEGLESTSSTSRTGVSQITMVFTYGSNLDRARNQIDRAISNAKRTLPSDVQPQAIAGSISDFPIVFLAVSSDKPLSDLNADLQRLSVPRLQKLDGVRSADVTGGASQHIEILPRTDAMAAAGVSLSAIKDALSNNGALVPAGTLQDQGKTLSLQIGSPVDSLDAIKALPLAGAKNAATIGSVADVSLKDDERTSITRTNGAETLAISVTKKPEGDTVAISHAVRDSLNDLQAELGSNAKFTPVFDQAPFIEKSIKDLTTEGLLGLGFAVAVILLFLMSARSTLVTAVSIPLSLLITFIGLSATGYSLNILTLGALTIAIGRVVDDSIVVIENIKRHLSYGEEKSTAILTAIREVAGAITASTLTTVAVFLPIAFVGELAGELFRPFALTVTMALLASLLVSLTIVPVLAYWFLKNPKDAPGGAPAGSSEAQRMAGEAKAKAHDAEQRSRLQRGYLPILRSTQKHPVITLVAAVLVLGATGAMTPLLATNLLGNSGQNSLTVKQVLPAGTSLADTSAAAIRLEEVLRGIDGIKDVQVTSGNAQAGFAALTSTGSSNSTFTVVTDEKANQERLQDTVRSELAKVPDSGKVSVGTQQGGFGTSSTVDITLKAATSADLQAASDTMVAAMAGVPGTSEVASNLAASQPVVQVKVDRAKAVAAGLNEQQVAGVLASTISPIPAGTVRIDTNDFPVRIGQGTKFTSIDAVRNIPLPAGGRPVTLGSIATVELVDTPVSITASNGERTAKVSITPSGSNLGAVNTEVQKRLADVQLPPRGHRHHRRRHHPAGRVLPAVGAGAAGRHRHRVRDHGGHVQVPRAAVDPAGVGSLRGNRRRGPAAAHRSATGPAVAHWHADAGGHRGHQRDRADRPDQPVPAAARRPPRHERGRRHHQRRTPAPPAHPDDRACHGLCPDPHGTGAYRRRRLHLAAAGRGGDRRAGVLHRADPDPRSGAVPAGGGTPREEGAAAGHAGAPADRSGLRHRRRVQGLDHRPGA